jgi:hypothetical protein
VPFWFSFPLLIPLYIWSHYILILLQNANMSMVNGENVIQQQDRSLWLVL